MSKRIHVEIKDLEKLNSFLEGKEPYFYVDGSDLFIPSYEIPEPNGYEPPEGFPNCCEFHGKTFSDINEWYTKFPACCKEHEEMATKSWFKRELYSELAIKTVNIISYTEFMISQKINDPDWYKSITDYFEYCIESYGNPTVGSGWYYEAMKHWVKNSTPKDYNFTKEKRNRLLEYLVNLSRPVGSDKGDITMLLATIERWKKTLPDLQIFQGIKQWKGIPFELITQEKEYNPYSKALKAKLKTKSVLIEHLTQITIHVLSKIEPNLNNYSNEEHLKILTAEHALKQKSLLTQYSQGEKKYVRILKAWLKNEKNFFKEISSLVDQKNQMIMAQFETEIRETHGKKYVKVFLREQKYIVEIRTLLEDLKSIKNVNITENKETDLTVYPAKLFTAEEVVDNINAALESFFTGSRLDPIFENQELSKISDQAYQQILNKIIVLGRNLEKLPRIHLNYDEEAFRDYFLPFLNSISTSHSATGETFNKIGKSDILIQDGEGMTVFIAECKIWNGSSELHSAIDQLLTRYISWRDEKAAIIVFNKDIKGFTDLLTKATTVFENHPNFEKYVSKRDASSFSFIFKSMEDPKKRIALELIIFNCIQQ